MSTTDALASTGSTALRGRTPHLLAAGCGVLVTVLSFATAFPAAPDPVTAGSVADWVAANRGALSWYGGSLSLAAVALTVFAAYLRTRVVERGPQARFYADAFLGCALLCAVWWLVAGGATALLVHDPDAVDGDVAVASYAVAALGDAVGTSALAARGGFLVLVGVALLAVPVLPRWLAWGATTLGVLTLAGVVGMVDEGGAADGLFYVGLFAFALWPLVAGVSLAVAALRPVAHR